MTGRPVVEGSVDCFSRRRMLAITPLSALALGMLDPVVLSQEVKSRGDAPGPQKDQVYDVSLYGAKGDGISLDTAAIQAAIDACTHDGGGKVVLSNGTFHTGSLELKSNVTLHIGAGATLLGSGDSRQYHAVGAIPLSGDVTLVDGNWALLFAVGARNVTVEGPGTISGQRRMSIGQGGRPSESVWSGTERPHHILAYQCEGLTIRNLDLLDSAYHCIRVIQSKRVHFESLYIHNRVNVNNDGFHFVSTHFLTISNCIVIAEDDACALFGSCQFVTVTNCMFSTRWSVFRFGGGQVKNVSVSNCVLHQVYGCPIKFQGNVNSTYENILFSNLVLDDVTGPIYVGLGPRPPEIDSPATSVKDDMTSTMVEQPGSPAVLRNLSFSNVRGTVNTHPGMVDGAGVRTTYRPGEEHSCIVLDAVGGATVENVALTDVHLVFGGGGTKEDASRRRLPEFAGEYFMLGPMPAYGLYARGVRGLTLNNVRFQLADRDQRPAVILDHVSDASMSHLAVQSDGEAESAVRLIDSSRVLITAPRLLSPAAVFLAVEGEQSARIIAQGGDIADAVEELLFKHGASPKAALLRV